MAFGTKVKQLREERNLSQVELARRAGVGQSTINKIEQGTRLNVTLDVAARVAAVFGVRVDDLLDEEEEEAVRLWRRYVQLVEAQGSSDPAIYNRVNRLIEPLFRQSPTAA